MENRRGHRRVTPLLLTLLENERITMKSQKYLDEMRLIAQQNGGQLLDTEWRGSLAKYRFSSADGTEFEMMQSNLKSRGWPKNSQTFAKNSRMEVERRQSSRHLVSVGSTAEKKAKSKY